MVVLVGGAVAYERGTPVAKTVREKARDIASGVGEGAGYQDFIAQSVF